MSSELGRRERKKLETGNDILRCAVELFTTRGYDATTMDEIAECADVSRATVFNYFARKEDLVVAWFGRRRTELATSLAEVDRHAAGGADRLRRTFRAIVHLFEDEPRTGRAMVRAWLRAGGPLLTPTSDTTRLLADIVRSGQQHGDISPDIDPDRAGQLLFDAYLGVLYRWVNDETGRFTFGGELLATLELALDGLTGARGES